MHIKNWRSHADTYLEFSPGTNVIVGRNGAGKTSVLDAIYFALFGELPGKKKYAQVLRNGTRSGEVTLLIRSGEREFRIHRMFTERGLVHSEIREKKGDKWILLATGRREDVNEVVERNLGTNPEIFERIAYTLQNEVDYFVNLPPGKRKEVFDSILGITFLENVRKSARSLANYAYRQASALKDREETLRILKARLEKEREELELLKKKIEGVDENLKQRQEALDGLLKKLETLGPKVEEYEKLTKRRAELSATIKTLSEEAQPLSLEDERAKLESLRKELEEKRTLKTRRDELLQRAKVLEGRARQLEAHLSTLPESAPNVGVLEGEVEELQRGVEYITTLEAEISSDIRNLEEHLATVEADLTQRTAIVEEYQSYYEQYMELKQLDPEKIVEAIQSEISRLRERIGELRAKVTEKEFLLKELKGDTCPVCGADITAKRDILRKKHEEELLELKRSLEEEERKLKDLENKLTKAKNALTTMKKLENYVQTYLRAKDGLEELKVNVRETKKRIETLRRMLMWIQSLRSKASASLEAARKKYMELRDLAAKAKLRPSLEKQLEETKKMLGAVLEELSKIPEIDLTAIQQQIAEAERRVRAAEAFEKVVKLKDELAQVEERIEELAPLKEQFLELQKQVASLNAEIETLRRHREDLLHQFQAKEGSLKDLQTLIHRFEEEIKRLDRLKAIGRWAEQLEVTVKKVQEIARSRLVEYINVALDMVWRALFPYPDYTEIRVRPTERDYILEVKNIRGEWVDVSTLSGGERSAAALALRISVSAVLSGDLRMLLLDEPTHNMDENVTQGLANLLQSLPREKIFEQIILITHKETLKSAATAKVYLLEREEGPTRVVELSAEPRRTAESSSPALSGDSSM